ncbi:hypothetical protein [Pseudomonas sp. H1h]|uniref:hypothetical protein n=1 Tax=Pseudomonas sp. H1h TaxID=1397280 RepID=UPI000A4510D1|nr:hypothetical protein [Pseudomonas sp. H1h]
MHGVTICEEWIAPVCVPTGRPASDHLHGARLLRGKTRPQAWDNWLRLADMTAADASRVDYEHFYLCIQAALAGLEIGMTSFLMVQDELKSGQLIAPFGFVRDGSSYCLLSARPFAQSTNAMLFQQWITQQMSLCSQQFAEGAAVHSPTVI